MSLFLLAALAAAMAPADAVGATTDVPHAVVLTNASPEIRLRAQAEIAALLDARSPEALATLLAANPPGPGRPPLMLGNFLSRDLLDAPGFDIARTLKINGAVQMAPETPPLNYDLLGAASAAQRDYLAQQMHAVLPPGAPTRIRAASFEELARIWYFIGWDLDEPLLVAEWNDRAYAFDFDPKGERITRIERLNAPCFTLGTETKKRLLDCHCLVVHRDGKQWQALFEPKPQTCPN